MCSRDGVTRVLFACFGQHLTIHDRLKVKLSCSVTNGIFRICVFKLRISFNRYPSIYCFRSFIFIVKRQVILNLKLRVMVMCSTCSCPTTGASWSRGRCCSFVSSCSSCELVLAAEGHFGNHIFTEIYDSECRLCLNLGVGSPLMIL